MIHRPSKTFYFRTITLLVTLLVFCLGLFAGCGAKKVQYDNLNLVNVSGTITLDSKHLPNAQILFIDNNKTYSYGVTDDNGRYALHFNSKMPGVTQGTKRVEIWTTRSGPDFETLMRTSLPVNEIIPTKYNLDSTLTETIASDRISIDFHLSGQGAKKKYFNPDMQTE